jgi:FkbM family methyltransferase
VLARRLKGSLKGLLAQRGYELNRLPDRGPFEAQRRLLLGHRVRTVFDLGAFVGDVTARYRSLFPDATVYSFEPFAGSFETLAERFRGDEFVKPQPLAVADQVGAAVLYVNGLAATNSLLPRPSEGQRYFPSDGETVATERVRTTTIEAFCGEHGLATIDVLKLDVQGGELAALRGAEGLLRKRAVGLIYTEASFVPHYRGAPLFHDVAALLAGHGYGLYNIYDMVRARNGQLRFADALFVSPELRRRALDDPPL